MFDLTMNAKCPRCYAESLILACKLLTGNRVTAQTWVCSSCETVFDRADLKSEHRRSDREKFSRWKKIPHGPACCERGELLSDSPSRSAPIEIGGRLPQFVFGQVAVVFA